MATYLYAEEDFYIVHTVLNWCNAEIEMLLNFTYFLIVQGESCWLN